MKKASIVVILSFVLTAALSVKLSYDPKKGYSYTITGPSAEEVIDAEVKLKNYIRKGKIPALPTSEDKSKK